MWDMNLALIFLIYSNHLEIVLSCFKSNICLLKEYSQNDFFFARSGCFTLHRG